MQDTDKSRSKRRAKVYPALREMCLDYAFWPRQQLHIEELAGVLSSSATPVREALARLAGEGLIEAVPNRGYVAKVLLEDEMRGNIDLLFTLMKESVSRSMERWTARDEIGCLETDAAEAIFSVTNATFSRVGSLSENEVLFEHILRLLEMTRLVRRIDLEDASAAAATRRFIVSLRGSLAAKDGASSLRSLHQQNYDLQQRLAHVVMEGRARSMSRNRPPSFVRTMLT